MSDAENKEQNRHHSQMFQSQSMTGESSAAEKAAPAGLLADYKRATNAFDEFTTDEGEPRPHYADLFRALEQLAGLAAEKSVKVVLRAVNVDVYKVLKLLKLTGRFVFLD